MKIVFFSKQIKPHIDNSPAACVLGGKPGVGAAADEGKGMWEMSCSKTDGKEDKGMGAVVGCGGGCCG